MGLGCHGNCLPLSLSSQRVYLCTSFLLSYCMLLLRLKKASKQASKKQALGNQLRSWWLMRMKGLGDQTHCANARSVPFYAQNVHPPIFLCTWWNKVLVGREEDRNRILLSYSPLKCHGNTSSQWWEHEAVVEFVSIIHSKIGPYLSCILE